MMDDPDQNSQASWSYDYRTIYLRQRQSLPLRVYYFLHELGHAAVDFTHYVMMEVGLVPKN